MRRITIIVALLACLLVSATAFAAARPLHNPADALAGQPIEGYRYDYAKGCLHGAQPGTVALERWLEQNAAGHAIGIYNCERLGSGYSLHAEGRALDWGLDVHVPAERREAYRLLDLFLASDSAGNQHALARRMGIQELIYNCTAWYGGDGGTIPYSPCYDSHGRPVKIDDTTAHRNHIHIGLNWPGARQQTSFWRAVAAARRGSAGAGGRR